MKFEAGTYGQLNRDGSFRGVLIAPGAFDGRSGCFLPLVVDSVPAFDPATQKVIQGNYVVEAAQVRQTWSVVALSAGELDALADASEDNALVGLYAKLVDGTATQNQKDRVLKRLCKAELRDRGLI